MLKKFKTDLAAANAVCDRVETLLSVKKDALICIAGGDTPLQTMQELVRRSETGQIDFREAYFVGLDEWVGLGLETPGSCRATLFSQLFDKLVGLKKEHICFFDGKAEDLAEECDRIDQFVDKRGGIDFILLGIGMNGHLGFNEPGVQIDLNAHVVELDSVTKQVMSKYFEKDLPLTQGISLGMKQILASKEIVVLATGTKKAEIIQLTVETEPTPQIPATFMKKAKNAQFFVDEAAGSLV